ncbi:MAG: HPF/RaiA family ribosome-associated protein [Candidatus Lambdaproteobacteria bacterium]|nr:HPF/RaiA family ribosome-associated protein [Candidatus Lambdaproteobacteria bacterium]
MQFAIHRNDVTLSGAIEKAMQHKIEKIEERLKRYHPDAAQLEVRLHRSEKLDEFECAIKLVAFKDHLQAKKSATELRAAIDQSFDAIMKEIDHYRLKINKSLQSSS